MLLSESRWRNLGLRNKVNVQFYTALPVMFPPCQKFSIALNAIREKKEVPAHFKHLLKKVDKNNKTCLFENLDTKEEFTVSYDFLHISPPQSAPDFISSSPFADKTGWMAASPETMQHPKYANVFACGDVAGIPCSKTAASTFSQVPVLVHNMCQVSKNAEANAKYNGYGSCPLFVGDNKLMLAEFKYGGVPCETFTTKQDVPLKSFYYFKKEIFPKVYFNLVPKGQWYGNKTIFKPTFF